MCQGLYRDCFRNAYVASARGTFTLDASEVFFGINGRGAVGTIEHRHGNKEGGRWNNVTLENIV
jgi:hypothetical protein